RRAAQLIDLRAGAGHHRAVSDGPTVEASSTKQPSDVQRDAGRAESPARAVPARRARAWTREPLLHFAVLGLALFGLFRVVGPAVPETGETIVVSADTL